MKHRSEQDKVKTKQDRPFIPYPPGYKGQPLTQQLIFFSDRLLNCPEEYRGIFTILLKEFALDLGCGDSEHSRDYLKAIADGVEAIWNHADFPAIAFLNIEEQCNHTSKRVLRIMPTLQLGELTGIVDADSGVGRDDAGASHTQTPVGTFAGVFNF